jgi:hypothetical protein
MRIRTVSMSRRRAIGLGLAGLGACLGAPAASAAPGVSFPLRAAYARVSPTGFVHIRSDEQAHWTRMATRMGGLVDQLAPMQPGDMFGGGLPSVEGGPSCAMVARQMALNAGYNQVILYATNDGQRAYAPPDGWFGDTFAWMQGEFDKDGRATGEAHLLDVGGGMPLASAHADAKPRDPLNLFDGGRNPERETLDSLIRAMELRLNAMALLAYESQRSIAD